MTRATPHDNYLPIRARSVATTGRSGLRPEALAGQHVAMCLGGMAMAHHWEGATGTPAYQNQPYGCRYDGTYECGGIGGQPTGGEGRRA